MGQYHLIVNIDREEYLHPHKFGDGLKLMEFGTSRSGVLLGLTGLLSDADGEGLGDINADDPVIGSWAGDRIVVAGDYGDGVENMPDLPESELQDVADAMFADGYRDPDRVNLYGLAKERFTDVSDDVIKAIAEARPENPLASIDADADGWRQREA